MVCVLGCRVVDYGSSGAASAVVVVAMVVVAAAGRRGRIRSRSREVQIWGVVIAGFVGCPTVSTEITTKPS